MADLFTPGANPDLPLPAYGELSPMEESNLYRADRPRWTEYVAQGYVQRWRDRGHARSMFLTQWCGVLSDEMRAALWARLDATERDEVRQAVAVFREKAAKVVS